MSHNPYTPPAAAVEDAPDVQIRRRPVAVMIAIALIGTHVLLSVIGYVRIWHMYLTASGFNLILLGVQVAKWLLLGAICLHLWRGRHWARVLLLVVTALALLSVLTQVWAINNVPAGVRYAVDPMAVVTLLLPLLTYVLAAVLVFIPGRAWFARHPG